MIIKLDEKEKKEFEIYLELDSVISEEIERKNAFDFLVENKFIDISAPLEEEPRMGMILLNDDFRKTSYSRKSGNITLNMGSLVKLIPDITLTVAGVLESNQFIKIMAALKIWDTVYSKSKIDFSIDEAITIYSLWKNCDKNHKINEDVGFSKTNEKRILYGINELSMQEYVNIIDKLISIESIELTEGIIWLREWVKVVY